MKLRRPKPDPTASTNGDQADAHAPTRSSATDDDATPLPELADCGPLLDRSQVAELLNVSPTTVWRLVRSGELPAYRVGNQIRVATADAEHYLKRTVPV